MPTTEEQPWNASLRRRSTFAERASMAGTQTLAQRSSSAGPAADNGAPVLVQPAVRSRMSSLGEGLSRLSLGLTDALRRLSMR